MPKQLNVNLAFTADTGKAAAGIKQLQSQLTQLMSTAALNSSSLGLTKDIKEATTAVAQLKAQLSNAMSSTGTLDLTKFNDSLKASGMTLEQYRTKLSALGPEGTAAFSKLASSIASAEIPIRRANGLLTELGTTLMNTARWQLSSSLLHGFIGGLQHAYGYAQDLNESLNNIRIVTGQSTDQMAQLAEKANKAAKELSTRTTDYTNASLIYYQQGLDDKAVEERTRTTLKLANVSRQSAEEVSTQMTAIWNNFDDGTKSLEYYADAITALGAKTASSSSEIAEGLSKFAAVADTIGLSYETATAALATVVAETRQSADVVGNAFKSIFSRLQSLKLGETLEDGVGLTKYSQALETVGVKVLDINGELREADEIMSDLGDRWTEISDTQKTALAQTVAGQRQYAQFVALFDNWDKVQQNIGIAEGSEGTLQDQADIYAESWEATSKRVQASAEAIYNALLDDKFFIGFNDFISKLLDGVNGLIKGFGGLGGTLTMLGALLTKTFSTQIAGQIDRIARNIQLSTKAGREAEQATQKQAIASLEKEAAQAQARGSFQGTAQAEGLKTQATLQETLINNQSRYNEEQLKTAQLLLDNNMKLKEQAEATGKAADEAKKAADAQARMEVAKAQSYASRNGQIGYDVNALQRQISDFEKLQMLVPSVQSEFDSFYEVIGSKGKTESQKIEEIGTIWEANISKIKQLLQDSGLQQSRVDYFGTFFDKLKQGDITLEQFKQRLDSVFTGLIKRSDISGDQLANEFFNFYGDADLAAQAVERLKDKFGLSAEQAKKLKEELEALKNSADGAKGKMDNMSSTTVSLGQKITGVAGMLMSLSTITTSLTSIFDSMGDSTKTVEERFTAVLSKLPSLLMSVGMLANSLNSIGVKGIVTGLAGLTSSFVTTGTAATVAETGVATFGQTLIVVVPYLAILAGAVGLLYLAFKKAEESTFDYKIQQAKKAAEEAGKQFEETKTQAEQLKTAFENYQSVRDELDNCTVGTEEWRAKLQEVNDQVLDIIKNFPQLRQYMSMKNGALSLDQEGYDKYQQLLKYQSLGQYWSQQSFEQEEQQLKNEQTKEQYFSPGGWNDIQLLDKNGREGAAVDISQYFEGAIDKVFNRYIEARDNEESDIDWEAELKDILAEVTTENGLYRDKEEALNNITDSYFYKGSDIMENFALILSQLEGYTQSKDLEEQSEQNLNPQLGAMVLGQNEDFMNKNGAEAVLNASGFLVDKLVEEINDKYYQNGKLNEAQIREDYANKYGEESIHKRDENNEIIEDEFIDTDTLFKTLAVEELDKNLPDLMTPVLDWYNSMVETGESEKIALAKTLTNNKLEMEEAKSLAEELGSGRSDYDIIKLLEEQLGLSNADELFEFAKSKGFETVNGMIEAIQEGLAEYDERVSKAETLDKATSWAQELFDRQLKGKEQYQSLEVEQKEQLHDLINNADDKSQVDLIKFFHDNINQIDDILNTINDSNSLVELISNLQKLGIEVDEDSSIIDILYNNLAKFKNIDDPSARYAERKKVVDGLSKGDFIDQEQYDTVKDIASDYFQLMGDGTYKLIKDAELLRSIVDENAFQDYKNQFLQYYKHNRGDWTEEDQQKTLVSTTSLSQVGQEYIEGHGKEMYGMSRKEAIDTYKNQHKDDTYSSVKDVLSAYNDKASYETREGTQEVRLLEFDEAKNKIQDVINTTKLGKEEIESMKKAMEQGFMDDSLFEKGLHSIASTATSFEELDEIIQESDVNTEIFTDDIIELLNQTGGSTEEKIAKLRHELELGNGEAQKLIQTMYELNTSDDNEKTTQENIQQNNETNKANQQDSKMTTEDKAESNKQAGLANINLIANADDMFDTDKVTAYYEELKKVQQGEQLTAMEARALGQAAAQIFKDTDFLGTERQIKGIRDAFAAVDGEIEPENLKAYADSIKDLILNSDSMNLDQKLATIRKELTDAGVPIEYLNQELGELILNDQNLTLDQKLAKIKDELGGAIPNELKHEIEEILVNEDTTTEMAIQRIKELCGDNYVLQETAAWIDKILNNGGTSTLEKLKEILSMANQLGVDQAANEMAKLYENDIKNYQDFQQIQANNNTQIASQKVNVENKAEEVKQANTEANAARENTSQGASVQDYQAQVYDNLTQKQKEFNQAKADEATVYDTVSESYQRYANNLNGANFDSLREMQAVEQGLIESGAQITEQMKAQDIIEYASKFDSCTPAIERYESAVASGTDTTKQLAEVMLMADAEDQAAKYGLEAEYVQSVSQSYADLAASEEDHNNTTLGDIEVTDNLEASYARLVEAANDVAIRTARADEANQDFVKNGKKYLDFLEDVTQKTNDYTDEQKESGAAAKAVIASSKDLTTTYNGLKKTVANALNVQEEFLDEKQVTKYAKKAIDAYNDVEGALDDLREEYTKDRLIDLGVEDVEDQVNAIMDQFNSLEIGDVIDLDDTESSALRDYMQGIVDDVISQGGSIQDAADACNSALSSIGYDADIEGFENAADAIAQEAEGMKDSVVQASDEAVEQGGINAEVNTQTDNLEDTSTISGFDATATQGDSFSITVPQFKAGTLPGTDKVVPIESGQSTVWGHTQGVSIEPKEEEITENKKTTTPAIGFSNLHKSAGGNIGGGSKSGGGGRGGGCFIAGTLITTQTGFKNIEDIKVGDIVLSYNEKTQQNEYSIVAQTMIHVVNENIYTIQIENEQIVATGIHPFLITRNEITKWIIAEELKVGDLVLFADGTFHRINKINVKVELKTVYNFEVNGNHNYYVGQNQILAHNKGGGRRGGGGRGRRAQQVRKETTATEGRVNTQKRYDTIDKTLSKLNDSYGKINKVKDLAFGKKHLEAIQKEIDLEKLLLEQQTKRYNKSIEYLNKDKTIISTSNISDRLDKNGRLKAGDNGEGLASYETETVTTRKKLTAEEKEERKKLKKKGKKKTKADKKRLTELKNITKKGIKVTSHDTQYTGININEILGGGTIDDYITKDDNGYQVNTDALNEKNDVKYNSFIAKYNEIMSNPNTSSKTKRKWENDKARQEALHQARQEYIEKIAEDIENAREDVNNIIDQQIQLLQSKIEEAVYEVDLKLDIDDSNLDILSEKIDRLGDSGRNAFATISLLGKEIEKLGEKSKTNIEGIEKIFSTIATKDNVQSVDEQNVAGQKDTQFTKDWGSSGFVNGVDIVKLLQSGEDSDYNTAWAALRGSADVGTITTEQLDEITERAKNQLDITKQIRETYFQMYEVLQNAMNFWSDELNRVLDKQQRILDTTKHYRNIIELIGGVNFEAMLKNGVAGNTLGMLGKDALVNANTKEYQDNALEKAKNQVGAGDQIRDLQRKTQAEMDNFAVQGNLKLIKSTKENQKFWEGQQKERATSVKTAKDNLDAAAANSQAKKQALDEAKAAEKAARQTAATDKVKRDAADAEVKRTNQNKNNAEENARKANEKAQNSVKAAEDRLKAFQKEKESYSKAWQEQSQFEPMVIESGALGKGKGKGKTEIMSYTTATGINSIGKGPSIQEERRLELEVAKAKAEAESTSKAEAAKVSSAKKELELAQKNQKIAYDSLTKYQAAQANTVAKQKEYETEDKSYQEKQKDWEKTVELYNDATDKVNEATDRAQQAIEDTYESVATRYENAMQAAADKFNEALGKNAGTLDMLAEALERFSKVNSTHVQEYEKVHQLRLMDLEAEEAINKATDPKIKRELLAIQNEITAKTAKDQQMSQYDLDLLKKKLELKQAEAAIEDAKNAKTQVSLTRDNEGNFGYVYTADDNNVADAEKNYADKIYEMQKLNADYINSLQSEIVSVQQEAMQKIQELSTNSIMPPEEKQARILAIEADYQQLHEDLLGELQQALSDSNDVYGEYSDLYAEVTGDLTATGLDYIGSFQKTQLAIQTGYEEISDITKNFQSATIGYINSTRTAWNDYVTDIQAVQTTSGENLSTYKTQATGDAGEIKKSLEEITSEFKTIATEASSSLSTASSALETFKTDWVGKMGIAQTAAENLASGVNKIKEALIELKKETDEDNGGGDGDGGNNPPVTNPVTTPSAKDNRKGNVTVGRRRYSSRRAKNRRRKTVTTAKQVDALKEKHLKYKREYKDIMRSREYRRASRRQRKKLRQKAIRAAKDQIKKLLTQHKSVTVQFKSGGYTGTWAGQDGKMAMLHQKELVLNKEDTENILSAVNTIRDLSQSIDLNALASAGAFASMTAGGVGKLNNALDQHVSIEANFPNATSREEIQAAFENLIGLASQYANR